MSTIFRPALRKAGSHSVICCSTILSTLIRPADPAPTRRAGESNWLTTSASRSARARAAVAAWRVGGRDHLIEPHGHRRQRRAERVRGVDGELAVGREQLGHPTGGAVEA